MDPYTAYYLNQAKTGIGAHTNSKQTGRGLGTFISKIFTTVYPYIKSGLSAVANELLSGGVGLIKDTVNQVPIKESIGNRVKTVGHNLTDRAVNSVLGMSGSGTTNIRKRKKSSQCKVRQAKSKKPKRAPKTKQKKASKKKSKSKKSIKKKVKTTKRQSGKGFNDIFG
jgi:hypothetical protein